ncbi:hypothetical protein EDC04DRAFT_901247 [Pisolithus marmoratus]|nr:hypothetical protein EDC04DRAFT_901247 [Pisolithus marmoratus]
MITAIQDLRTEHPSWHKRIAIEFNASCPNIKGHPPPAYHFASLVPFLDIFAEHFRADPHSDNGSQATALHHVHSVPRRHRWYMQRNTRQHSLSGQFMNPFAFLTCTNTLGNSLVFSDQTVDTGADESSFALPPGIGGLAGEAIHSLSLGNVYSFSELLAESPDQHCERSSSSVPAVLPHRRQ